METTEKLSLEVLEEELIVPNKSGFYHNALRTWFDYFGLVGKGIIVGDKEEVKSVLKKHYPNITEIFNVTLVQKQSICWDITAPYTKGDLEADWIICQAVLEHVVDPVSSMKNLSELLVAGGLFFLHVPAFGYGYHAFPIDCYRFSRDTLVAFEDLANLDMIDSFCDSQRVMAVYKKRKLV